MIRTYFQEIQNPRGNAVLGSFVALNLDWVGLGRRPLVSRDCNNKKCPKAQKALNAVILDLKNVDRLPGTVAGMIYSVIPGTN